MDCDEDVAEEKLLELNVESKLKNKKENVIGKNNTKLKPTYSTIDWSSDDESYPRRKGYDCDEEEKPGPSYKMHGTGKPFEANLNREFLEPENDGIKIVFSNLPPNLKEAQFLELVGGLPANNYFFYKPPIEMGSVPPCRAAIINFLDKNEVNFWCDKLNGVLLYGKNGTEYYVTVDVMMNQEIPKQDEEEDELMGTLEFDEEFVEFLKKYEVLGSRLGGIEVNPNGEITVDTMLQEIEEKQAKPKLIDTPLTEFLIAKGEEDQRKAMIAKEEEEARLKEAKEKRNKLRQERREKRDKERKDRREKRDKEQKARSEQEYLEKQAKEKKRKEKEARREKKATKRSTEAKAKKLPEAAAAPAEKLETQTTKSKVVAEVTKNKTTESAPSTKTDEIKKVEEEASGNQKIEKVGPTTKPQEERKDDKRKNSRPDMQIYRPGGWRRKQEGSRIQQTQSTSGSVNEARPGTSKAGQLENVVEKPVQKKTNEDADASNSSKTQEENRDDKRKKVYRPREWRRSTAPTSGGGGGRGQGGQFQRNGYNEKSSTNQKQGSASTESKP